MRYAGAGMRLSCCRAPGASVRRCARTRVCGQRRIAPLMRYAGAGMRLSCWRATGAKRAALRAHPKKTETGQRRCD